MTTGLFGGVPVMALSDHHDRCSCDDGACDEDHQGPVKFLHPFV